MDGKISPREGNLDFEMAIESINLKQGLKASILLGWRIETNWANIFVVFLIKCSRPLAVALMLSAMYSIASGPNADIEDLAWVITGVCIWGFIQSATELYSYAIIGEREWFRNIKNIITAPTPLSVYLLGRTALWVPVGILNMFIILILGNILLNLQLNIDEIHVTKFILYLFMGFISVISLGFFVSGITLLTPRFGEGTAFGVTGALYLVSGALIKVELFPELLQLISNSLPFTHWIEIIRFTLFDYFRNSPPPIAEFIYTSIIFYIFSILVFKICLNYSRKVGKIDLATMY